MQKAKDATTGGRTELSITRRWPELYFGPLFLLALLAARYSLAHGQGGELFWQAGLYISIVLAIFISLTYALHEGRLRFRVTGDGWSVACNNAILLREITADSIVTGELVRFAVPVHRFQTHSGVLLVRGRLSNMVKLAEALCCADELDRAVRKVHPRIPGNASRILKKKYSSSRNP